MLRSAIVVHSLSAPRSPAPGPVSPKRRSPPKPCGLPDSSCSAFTLVTKNEKCGSECGSASIAASTPAASSLPQAVAVRAMPRTAGRVRMGLLSGR
jgi:hypothetical protein